MENRIKKIVFRTLKPCKVRTIRDTDIHYLVKDNKGKIVKKRAIQYCKDLPTIFVDEQLKITDKPKRTPLYLQNSDIEIKETDIVQLDYLKKHPDNVINGGTIFKLLDVDNDELLQVESYKLRNKANSFIDNKKDAEIISCAMWLWGNSYTKLKVSRIKIALYEAIKNDEKFSKTIIDYFENKNNQERTILTLALQHNIISISKGKTVIWGTDGENIYTGSQSKDVIKECAMWLRTDEKGRQELNLMAEKLDEVLPKK